MATSIVSLVQNSFVKLLTKRPCICYQSVRFRRLRRNPGKSHHEASSLNDRIAEINEKDPVLDLDINIGFPLQVERSNPHQRHKEWTKLKKDREQAARQRKLIIPLEEVKTSWQTELGPKHIHKCAEHYGIFHDMFDDAYFYPSTFLNITYDYDEEFVTPVCYGNKIPPAEAAVRPYVQYDSADDSMWTLVMSSPDGHLQDNDKECLHWMVSNIPGSNVDKGETICDYMRPFPPEGVGLLRYVFILYKQDGWVDLSEEQRPDKCLSLSERTFSTLDFYRDQQDSLTPASVSFFQAGWDPSVRDFYRHTLEMAAPKFEFIHPSHYHPKQEKFPHSEPFNLYLDRYRDVKDINEEVLKEKLRRISPFQENKPRPKFPCLVPFPKAMASWQKTRTQNMRLRRHQWKDLPE